MKKVKSFTLVEMILYIGLVSIFVVSLASFLSFFTQAKNKSSTIEEVNQQAVFISSYIEQLIRDSDSISLPAKTTSAATTTLVSTKFPTRSPIVISLSGGKLLVSEAGAGGVQISSDKVTISNLSFTNLSQSSTNGNLQYQYQIAYNNPHGQNAFSFIQIFHGSATTR